MDKVLKQFSISLDTKRSTSNRDFEVVHGDNGNVLEITLTDDGQPVDLSESFILAVFSKSDGRTAAQDNHGNGITLDEEQPGKLYIELYTTSFAPGLVECELQVYSGEEHRTLATTAKFNFMCRLGIANKTTIAETDEWPVLIAMLDRVDGAEEELHLLNEETAQAAAEAHTAANRANEAGEYAEEVSDEVKANEAERVAAENLRLSAELERIDAENARGTAELQRIAAEDERIEDEEQRRADELLRQGAESARQTAESIRTASEEARVERDNAFSVWEPYDSGREYVPLNKVSYGGSSYLCILDTQGVAPPNPSYWLLIAAKGLDGDGAGDMIKAVYDKTDSGTVDDADRLGGRLAEDYLTQETDPTVPDWAKEEEKPTYTAAEVGAATVTHASEHATGGADELTPADIGAAISSFAVTVTLTSGGWANSQQTVTVEGMRANSNAIFDIDSTATDTQYEAGKKAKLSPSAQGENSLTVRARGTVPTIDVPLTVMVLG